MNLTDIKIPQRREVYLMVTLAGHLISDRQLAVNLFRRTIDRYKAGISDIDLPTIFNQTVEDLHLQLDDGTLLVYFSALEFAFEQFRHIENGQFDLCVELVQILMDKARQSLHKFEIQHNCKADEVEAAFLSGINPLVYYAWKEKYAKK